MSSLPPILPKLSEADGMLPVNAELIERKISQTWTTFFESTPSEHRPARLCLANLLVITDADNRVDAERLATEIASLHPSRIILTVIDDKLQAFSAFVSTSCSRDRESGAIRCWEVIQILSDREHAADIPGALRSLVVGSVPVLSVDFRPYQNTPILDKAVLDLSDYVLVNAEIVPTSAFERTTLSLRWYWTFPLREMIGDLFTAIGEADRSNAATGFTFHTRPDRDSYDDLMSGWIMHRLGAKVTGLEGTVVLTEANGQAIAFQTAPVEESSDRLITVRLLYGPDVTINVSISEDCSEAVYSCQFGSVHLERRLSDYALSRYVIGLLQDSTEFEEYVQSCKAARLLAIRTDSV